jgi:hypothetical protein
VFYVLAVLILAAIGGVWWVSHNLTRGWVKERLVDLTGVDLDYTGARLSILSGIHLDGLTVHSADEWHDYAPVVLKAGGLDLGWSLFSKEGTLKTVLAEDVEIVIAYDEHGHTSLEGIRDTGEEEKPEPPEPPMTPGHALRHIMESIPQFGHISLTRANLTLIKVKEKRIVERTRLAGFSLDAKERGGQEDQHVDLVLGSKLFPEKLTLTDDAGEAHGKVWLDAALDEGHAEVHGEIDYDAQTLSKDWPKKGTLLGIDAKARAEHDKLAVQLDRFDLTNEALTAKGAIDVDPGRAHVLNAQGKIDIDGLLHLLPKGLVPVELKSGKARYDVALLEVSATPSLDPKGRLEIDGSLAGVRLSGSTALTLDQAKLEVRGKPTPKGGLALTADLPAGTLHVEGGGTRGNLGDVHIGASATFSAGQPGRADARVRFGTLSGDGPPGQLAATAGDLSLKLGEITIDPKSPSSFDGTVQLTGALGSFDAKRPEARTHVTDLRFDAHTKIVKGAPGAVEVALPLGSVEVASRTETVLPAGPAKLGLRVDKVVFDKAEPARSSVDAKLDVAVGPITLGGTVQKRAGFVDFDVTLDAKRTSLLTVFAPESLHLPGARMAMHLTAKGRAEASRLKAQAALHLDKPGATIQDDAISASQLDLTASIDGSLRKQSLSLQITPQGLALDEETLGSGSLAVQASWDLSKPSLELHADGRGEALPEGKLALTASVDKKTKTLTYSIDGNLAHLAALEPFVTQSDDHWVDLSDLRAAVKSHGTLTGIIHGVDKQGLPEFEKRAWLRLAGDGESDLTLEQVHYVDVAGVELTLPKLELHGNVRAEGEHRTLDVDMHIPRAALEADEHHLELTEMHDKVTLTATGDPRTADLDATHKLTIGKLVQDWVKAYPIANLSWTGKARRSSDGTLRVEEVLLENPGGGTRLDLKGALILPRTLGKSEGKSVPLVGFRSMTTHLVLDQQLGKLNGDPKNFRGGGAVSIQADVASGDLHRFHIVTATKLQKATIELPEKKMSFVGIDGSMPITEDLRVEKKKVSFAEIRETNTYPALRFSDQHPFLSGSGGLSANQITVGNLTLTKVAGNLRLQRNLFAIDQLEAETRGGHITGQCLLAMKGNQSTVQLHLRMTGIEAIHGGVKERFDGNTALMLSVADRTIEGRAEILRIGRNHLYDLLDQYDPHHSDAGTNRVRTALELGYPERVRIVFERGFASYSITFGGLAKLVKVADVRGIPTGPLVDKYLGPLFALENTP